VIQIPSFEVSSTLPAHLASLKMVMIVGKVQLEEV